MFFTGFEKVRVEVEPGVTINAVVGGSGPPLLLLHGFPQTLVMWHRVGPALAKDFTIVAADLRGYGDSSKPPSDGTHAAYSFRAMAGDQLKLMRTLGHQRFSIVGHDRGARVAHRLALDHSACVERLVLLDVLPTPYLWLMMNKELATENYHLLFFLQPRNLAEKLIAADPSLVVQCALDRHGSTLAAHDARALAEYERCFADPDTVHAVCEDYRAAATIDLDHDRASEGAKIAAPLLVLWGRKGLVARKFDPLDVWSKYADDLTGHALEAGHFLVDEMPEAVAGAIAAFMTRRSVQVK